MPYTTATLISNYLQRTLTADETAYLVILIPAIKIWLDRKLGTTFDSAAETTRYYDGGGNVVNIDPATTITAVKTYNNDGTLADTYTDLEDYVAEPINETVKTQLVRRSGIFPRGNRRVAVTAVFSEYDATNTKVPEDIQVAATRIAADVLQSSSQSTTANVASESLEGHSISYKNPNEIIDKVAMEDPFVMSILEQRRELFVG